MKGIQLFKLIKQFKGIGQPVSKKICLILGYDFRLNVKNLKKKDLERVDLIIRERVVIDKALNFQIKKNIEKSKKIRNYVGRRHSLGLPTRGQRTHSNGSTARRLGFYKNNLNVNTIKKKKK